MLNPVTSTTMAGVDSVTLKPVDSNPDPIPNDDGQTPPGVANPIEIDFTDNNVGAVSYVSLNLAIQALRS